LSDQLSEPVVEPESGWRIDTPVGSSEYRFTIRVVADGPTVFVKEAVVIAT
jgi:hypothetical protein